MAVLFGARCAVAPDTDGLELSSNGDLAATHGVRALLTAFDDGGMIQVGLTGETATAIRDALNELLGVEPTSAAAHRWAALPAERRRDLLEYLEHGESGMTTPQEWRAAVDAAVEVLDAIVETPRAAPPARCRVCGCTDNQACEYPCHWVEPDLCSECVDSRSEEDEER